MDYVKRAIYGPDPKEQMRKINSLLRKNARELERSMNQLKPLQKKTETLIKKSAKAGDVKSARLYARELLNIRRQYNKLHTSKARLESVTMSINEQYQMQKLTQSIGSSTAIMKDVNQLVHVGAISQTMQELSKELTKAGIINEMMDDMVDLEMEDDELEGESLDEVNKIIENLTDDKLNKIEAEVPEFTEPETPEVEEEDLHELEEMRDRLKALNG
ncbi:vacuolar protein-sorting-associated protein 24 [Diutina catenulata]